MNAPENSLNVPVELVIHSKAQAVLPGDTGE